MPISAFIRWKQADGSYQHWEYPALNPLDGTGLECLQARAEFAGKPMTQKLTLLSPVEPVLPTSMHWEPLPCAGSGTDVITNITLGATEPDDDGSGDGGSGITTQQVASTNPGVMNLSVEWSGGQARLVDSASPAVGGGESVYYFIGGQLPVSALPGGYNLLAGDRLSIMKAIATQPTTYNSNWNTKASAEIIIGPAPTP